MEAVYTVLPRTGKGLGNSTGQRKDYIGTLILCSSFRPEMYSPCTSGERQPMCVRRIPVQGRDGR